MRRVLLTSLFCVSMLAASAQIDSAVVDSTIIEDFDSDAFLDSIKSTIARPSGASVDPLETQSAKDYLDEPVSNKAFDKKKVKDVVGNADFTEEKEEKEPEAKTEKNGEDDSSPWSLPAINPALAKSIAYAVIVGLLGFILYYVAINTKITRKVKEIKTKVDGAVVEDIDEFDSDGLLRAALASNDLRLAIRAHYLLLLRKLNEVGLIKWKKDKTNRDYLSELYGQNDCYDDVRKLTLAYELVWYGERSVSPESFQRLAGDFETVSRIVTPRNPAAS